MMIRAIKYVISCMLLLCTFHMLYAQQKVYRIYGDSSFLHLRKFRDRYVFKDTLPDGKWYFYKTKDSTKENLDKYLILEGEYKDSIKNGTFKYYRWGDLEEVENYKNGKLHGPEFFYCVDWVKERKMLSVKYRKKLYVYHVGNYYEGYADGFFVEYDFDEHGYLRPHKIRLYDKGTLKAWVVYKKIKKNGREFVTLEIEAYGIDKEMPSELWYKF